MKTGFLARLRSKFTYKPENEDGKKHLRFLDYLSFGGAMFGNGVLTGFMQTYLMTYCLLILPDNVKWLLAPLFLIVKVWDGINDPILGVVIDRTRPTKWGKMRPYILIASIPFGLLTASFYVLPAAFSPYLKIGFIFVLYLIWDAVSTLVDVPLNGMYSVMTPNKTERTGMVTITRLLGSAGGEVPLIVYTVVLMLYGGKQYMRQSITVSALIVSAIAPVLLILGTLRARERLTINMEPPKIRDSLRYLKTNKPLISLLTAHFLSFFRNIVSASIIYLVAIVFAAPEQQILFSIPGSLASVAGMLIAPALIKRLDGKTIYIWATVVHSAALAIVYAAGKAVMSFDMTAGMYTIAALSVLAMLPVGLLNTVPTIMCTDIVDYSELKTGIRNEGMTFSLMTLRGKVASGCKDAVMILLLVVIFKLQGDKDAETFAPQSDYTKEGILLMYTLIPAVLNLVCLIPLKWYELSGKKMKEVYKELEKVRESRGGRLISE